MESTRFRIAGHFGMEAAAIEPAALSFWRARSNSVERGFRKDFPARRSQRGLGGTLWVPPIEASFFGCPPREALYTAP